MLISHECSRNGSTVSLSVAERAVLLRVSYRDDKPSG
jgi:hypothetical protein